jgi:glycosyltransferase involved in cell wall biosynthesis
MMYSEREAPPRHLVHVFPSFAVGGSQSRFLQLVKNGPDRYHHTVLSLDGATEMQSRISPELPVTVVHPALDKSSGLRSWLHCRNYLRQFRPDMLVTYNWGAMDWCLSNRIAPLARHVHIEDGFGPEERKSQLRRRVWGRRLALSGSNSMVVVPSQSLARLARESWKIPSANLRYVPNGVDCARFQGASERAPGPLVIGTVAALRPEKNLARLIRLFDAFVTRRPQSQLVIVGDGPERQKLEALAAATGRGDRILFTGATLTPEREFARFDIFALSSDTEQMPLSVLEAMASGLPILSFDVGDVGAMVAEENHSQAAIPLANDDAFLRHMGELAERGPLRRRLGMANRERARTMFDQQLMLQRYFELFG